ncbi:MAG: hypothetical protein O7F76_05120 [Planctomycetota bacterium]|nr:hypothetical protein [Planctomycetota bacterium]
MSARSRILLIAASAIALAGSVAFAQRYQGGNNRQGRRVTRKESRRDRDTERGWIVRILTYSGGDKNRRGRNKAEGNGPSKTGSIVIKTEQGRQFTGVLTTETRYSARSARITPSRTKSLLIRGVPVELNWRTSDKLSGRVVSDIRVRTIEIEGVIKQANRKKVTVMARPKQSPEELPQIKVRGRKSTENKKRVKRPAPRKLVLTLSEASAITLEGDEADIKDIKPTMKFDAVVIDGGPSIILDLNARSVKESRDPKKGKRKPKSTDRTP